MYHAVSPRSSSKLEKHLHKDTIDGIVALHATKRQAIGEGLCDQLWNECLSIAEEALNTQYIQGIHNGHLSPNDYGGYTVQDAIYCYNATDNLKHVKDKSNGEVEIFVAARERSFKEYTDALFEQWYINDPTGIDLGKAAKEYSDYETEVANNMNPLYYLVAMVPCDKLWPWLAKKIKDGEGPNNVYSFWIEENAGGSGDGCLEKFIDARADELDKGKALEVYRRCMQGELNFFKSATGDYK